MIRLVVDQMVRRSVRRQFRNVYWIPPKQTPQSAIYIANHHGWFDGYVMHLAFCKVGVKIFGWVEELDAFPPFSSIGALPFPQGDSIQRARTIRRTIRLLKANEGSLLLFPEGVLHHPPHVAPLQKGLEFLVKAIPGISVVPVAIRYEMGIHERPECFIAFGEPLDTGKDITRRAQIALQDLLNQVSYQMRSQPEALPILFRGTPDVNERWDMRKIRRSRNCKDAHRK